MYKRSVDSASSFEDTIDFSTQFLDGDSSAKLLDPQIAVYEDNVYVIWMQNTPDEISGNGIYFSKSEDNGITFEQPIKLVADDEINFYYEPKIAVSENGVYVTWMGSNTSTSSISLNIVLSSHLSIGYSIGLF
jgi:hypothetical protein